MITEPLGCSAQSECFNVIISSTGDPLLSDRLILYPNPTKDYALLLNQTGLDLHQVEVFNLQGQHMRSVIYHDSKIDLTGMKTGIYYIRITLGEVIVTKRLVIF